MNLKRRWSRVVSTEKDQNESVYEVGHGRPPAEYRFKKGQSGNPKGRPRGSKNLMTLMEHELEQQVPVQEGGQRRKITKREAMVKQLINKAVLGDLKTFLFLLPHIQEAEAREQARRERTSLDHEKLSLLEQAVRILADAGVEIPVTKTTA
jgi:uncharacterized protein DUF5681